MNARLESVRTASKVAVQLVWQVAADLPAGPKAARGLLLKDPVQLTGADRDSLHRFFRERIEQAKSDDTAASWEQQLAQVFDYTSWHQFVVKVGRANGAGWQLLTRKLHGALSGGEKAIANSHRVVCCGQQQIRRRSPESCAQVRILLEAHKSNMWMILVLVIWEGPSVYRRCVLADG